MSSLGLALRLTPLYYTRIHVSEFRDDMLSSVSSLEHCGSGKGEFPTKAWTVSGQGETGQAEWELYPATWAGQCKLVIDSCVLALNS